MRVGILTFHDGLNYGAFFQVYALQTVLRRAGHDCWVINYKSRGFTKREYLAHFNVRRPARSARNFVKLLRFRKAQRRLPLTRRVFAPEALSALPFDRVVIGSDEVWNFATRLIGYDLVYFSKGIHAGGVMSYAASFGTVNAGDDIPDELQDCLSRVDPVSVRDTNSLDILTRLGRKDVSMVLDPAFLVDFKETAVRPSGNPEYLAVYGYQFPGGAQQQIRSYAAAAGLETVSLGFRHPWCDRSLDSIGPFQWLGYMLHSRAVVTTMYHGMILSVMCGVPFCMVRTPYRANKLGCLPEDIGITDRLLDEKGALQEVLGRSIDYDDVNDRVRKLRERSEDYLMSALA
jgi:hypothetical protein